MGPAWKCRPGYVWSQNGAKKCQKQVFLKHQARNKHMRNLQISQACCGDLDFIKRFWFMIRIQFNGGGWERASQVVAPAFKRCQISSKQMPFVEQFVHLGGPWREPLILEEM